MPLLDIATAQPCSCFHNNVLELRSQSHFNNKVVIGNARRLVYSFSWKPFHIQEKPRKIFDLGRIEVCLGGVMIKAVATLESTSTTRKNDYQNALRMDVDSRSSNGFMVGRQSSSENSTEVDERETLRRLRISQANKGNRPWNKGRKHSPETLQLIREKTRLAMQDPKVKMKLANLGHAQSEETRMKIGVSVRLGWEKRREKLMLQEACCYEWKNLTAEASRRGLLGEEQLQWDTYKILRKQFEQEWLQSVEERKKVPKLKGNKKAPKSAEQRRKISEAISAKWTDPEYRSRVCSGMFKFHGIRDGAERKTKRKPSSDALTRKRSPPKNKYNGIDNLAQCEPKSRIQGIRLKRNNNTSYKDPLASFKLKMLKNIQAQRAAAGNQKSETVERAKILIAEAEKAANALEILAKNSPRAQAYLLETRMLITEAMQYIESIKNRDVVSYKRDSNSSPSSILAEEETDTEIRSLSHIEKRNLNGVGILASTSFVTEGFNFDKLVLPDFLNGSAVSSNSCNNDLLRSGEELDHTSYSDFPPPELDSLRNPSLSDGLKFQPEKIETRPEQITITKKWLCGRLVEVTEEH
ncbi:hypothetical protein Adt_00045 [Abeliophyllum distichum]|uniref:Nuclease associated modular domain-containing protein n=1 Tax=Abeliophyllum distichum TaxID=126358 RepID=A0ABD1VNZ2_9LAMI